MDGEPPAAGLAERASGIVSLSWSWLSRRRRQRRAPSYLPFIPSFVGFFLFQLAVRLVSAQGPLPSSFPSLSSSAPPSAATAVEAGAGTADSPIEIADNSIVTAVVSNSNSTIFHFPTFSAPQAYITLSICSGPQPVSPEQLRLYVSTDPSNTAPGPSKPPSEPRLSANATLGFANVTAESTSANGIWVGVWPPTGSQSGGPQGIWSFQLGASTSSPLHTVHNFAGLGFDDTDATHALLTSYNYTSSPNVSSTFVAPNLTAVLLPTYPNGSVAPSAGHPVGSNTTSFYLSRSFCALTQAPERVPGNQANASATTRGVGGGWRTQFEWEGLQKSTNYSAWLIKGDGSRGGGLGGELWSRIMFRTKSSDACALVHSLDFCPNVAYAVPAPSGPGAISMDAALGVYNSTVSPNFANFTQTMSTYPCGITLYSPVKTCADCNAAYRDWLCAVSMPRCTDVGGTQVEGQLEANGTLSTVAPPATLGRTPGSANASVASRNPLIDSDIKPGAYDEVPPCLEVCNAVARACPAFLSWVCPTWGVTAEMSYGNFIPGSGGRGGAKGAASDVYGNVWCNGMGVDQVLAENAGVRSSVAPSSALAVVVVLAAGFSFSPLPLLL